MPRIKNLNVSEYYVIKDKSHTNDKDHLHANKALLDTYTTGIAGVPCYAMPALEVYVVEFN